MSGRPVPGESPIHSKNQRLSHNPTHSTSPTLIMSFKALCSIARVGCDGFVGLIWSFLPPLPIALLSHLLENTTCTCIHSIHVLQFN